MSVLVTESRAESGEGENEKEVYPERPYKGDCFHYLRTGWCGFGSQCQFNHPRDRAGSIVGAMSGRHVNYPERIGQPVCKYYLQNNYCKFGAACKYHHPRPPKQGMGFGSYNPVALNELGYPLRPREKECSYYVKTGQCKFGDTCKFHHPKNPVALIVLGYPLRPMSTNKGKDVAIGGWAGFPEEKKKKGENVAADASIQAIKPNPWVQPAGGGGSPVTPPTNVWVNLAGGRGGVINCNPAPNAIPVGEDIQELPVGEDIDDNSDDESDESATSHNERKNNKWNCGFFITLDTLTAQQINDPNRDWHCPACKDGRNHARWFTGLQSLVDHAKKVSRRVKIHRGFAQLLEQELKIRCAS